MKKNNQIIIAVAIAVVFAATGFYGGTLYQTSKNSSNLATRGGQFAGMRQNGAGAPSGARMGGVGRGNFVTGSILKQDDKSITVQVQGGGSKIIYLSGTTTISKSTDGTKADLTQGQNVLVSGADNADGSVTATNIQLRPAGIPVEPSGNMPRQNQIK